jgi:hypothetical protein
MTLDLCPRDRVSEIRKVIKVADMIVVCLEGGCLLVVRGCTSRVVVQAFAASKSAQTASPTILARLQADLPILAIGASVF